MKQIVFFTLFIFLFGGCTKFGKNVTIKGRVLNPITGEGIEGAEIWLQKTTLGLPGGLKTVKKVTSSADGSFELNKFGLVGYSAICVVGDRYRLGWTQDGGASFTGNFTLDVKKGKVMHADYYAVPYGNLQIHFKNISCFDSNDKVKLYFDGGKYDGFTFSSGLLIELNGCIDILDSPVKTTIGTKYFHWEVTKNNIISNYSGSIVINENQTSSLNVFY